MLSKGHDLNVKLIGTPWCFWKGMIWMLVNTLVGQIIFNWFAVEIKVGFIAIDPQFLKAVKLFFIAI